MLLGIHLPLLIGPNVAAPAPPCWSKPCERLGHA